jgi:hypothetical protein
MLLTALLIIVARLVGLTQEIYVYISFWHELLSNKWDIFDELKSHEYLSNIEYVNFVVA